MSLVLSPPKIVLLAAQQAANADIDSLAFLAAQHGDILRKELLLRIILTYLPSNIKSADYVSFVQEVNSGLYTQLGPQELDTSHVEDLTDDEASKKVRKLRLRQLAWTDAPEEAAEDPITLFLIQRAYAVDEGAGSLSELPQLITPFLDNSPYLRTWMVSTLLPLMRRNCEYYPEHSIPQSLSSFEQLPDRAAVKNLLSQTGLREEDLSYIGRDLKGLVGPWLYNDVRWTNRRKHAVNARSKVKSHGNQTSTDAGLCPGWEQVLQWLIAQASRSWKVAVNAVEQWGGPGDFDLGGYGAMKLDDTEQGYLTKTYARAALATAYLIPEASVNALIGANNIVSKIMGLLDQDQCPSLQIAASLLSPVPEATRKGILASKNATYLRNDLLADSNILTSPSREATILLHALVLSAFILTKAGTPCTIRRVGELALLQDEREQTTESGKLIHSISTNGPKNDDKFWLRVKNEIMWLRDWGAEEDPASSPSPPDRRGVFGQVKKEFLEVEILKALLTNQRYTLARSLYEDAPDAPLSKKVLQGTIFAAAMTAYDNASNPNRTRGGLKKCSDILYAFPETIEESSVAAQRTEALLRATHALSDYRLVLKQGEPFTPVVLRVHTDPISIVGKVLEQNPKSYTQIQELLDLGAHMVEAGLTVKEKSGHAALTTEQEPLQKSIAERRITAMCIDAALDEDDFETAYSYVVGRLTAISEPSKSSRSTDEWSWKAALQAGKYKRTPRTVRPTHLGTASGNPEIRHLEQRIECLSTALRIAPPATLQEILNTYRRCEEELDSAIKAEDAQESAWDEAGDMQSMPGGFKTSPGPHGVLSSRAAAAAGSSAGRQHTEEAPLSLFDLSRATARAAQRNLNFTALSGLQRSGDSRVSEPLVSSGQDETQRVRKRDQFRDAAVGTLTSGVGWLIGAQPVRNPERE